MLPAGHCSPTYAAGRPGSLRGHVLERRGWGGGFTVMKAECACAGVYTCVCLHMCVRVDGAGRGLGTSGWLRKQPLELEWKGG